MDYATEQQLCQLAHEVWRQLAAEPGCGTSCRGESAADADAGRSVLDALHLEEVFALHGGGIGPC